MLICLGLGILIGADSSIQAITVDELSMVSLTGEADVMGLAMGKTYAKRIQVLSAVMGKKPPAQNLRRIKDQEDRINAIRPEHRLEITAIATLADVDAQRLLQAHLVTDSMCSAVAVLPDADRPLRVARNMDYFPADLLGPQTMITVWHATDQHAVASIGWPGFCGVISGINETGLSACILLNYNGDKLPPAEPLPLFLRYLLATCDSVDSFATAFAAQQAGSSHYVLVADTKTAALFWWGLDGIHRADPHSGILAADNETRQENGDPDGERACMLRDLSQDHPNDEAWLRRCLSATFLPNLNAQSMVLTPSTRSVTLARGGTLFPAARQTWLQVNLAPVLKGQAPSVDHVTRLAAIEALHHYAD